MTGQTAIGGMNLAAADKRRACGNMTAHAILRNLVWVGNRVDRNRGAMGMVMGFEVTGMALNAAAARIVIDPGIAVRARPEGAVGRIVAGVTVALMDPVDPVSDVAVDAERGLGHRGRMVVEVAVEILAVTNDAGATDNSCDLWAARKVCHQCRR